MLPSLLKNTCFFLHKQDWKLLEVSLNIPGSVTTNMASDGLTSHEKYVVVVTQNMATNVQISP